MPPAKQRFLPPRRPLPTWGLVGVVLVLAWIAGYVDAVGYLALIGVYTSHMSGNTAAMGRYFVAGNGYQVVRHAWPLIAFVLGLIVGATLTELARRRKCHSRLALVLLVEIALLASIAGADPRHAASIAWLGFPAVAMGMQTVTVTRVGRQRVYSTYITGSLSKFGEALAGFGFWLFDRAKNHGADQQAQFPSRRRGWLSEAMRHKLLAHALLNGGLWALFLGGAVSGALAAGAKGLHAFWWPILGLVLLVVLDWRHPIAPITPGEPLGFEA